MGDPLSSNTIPTRPPDGPEQQTDSGHTVESATAAPTGAETDSGEPKPQPSVEQPVDAELEERKRREEEERLERKKVPSTALQHADTYSVNTEALLMRKVFAL